jgi:hypothetical protein
VDAENEIISRNLVLLANQNLQNNEKSAPPTNQRYNNR